MASTDKHPIRVCLFSSLSSLTTGMPICVADTASLVASDVGFQLYLVLPSVGDFRRRLGKSPVEIKEIPFERLSLARGPLPILLFLVRLPAVWGRLYGFLRREKIDVVHFSDIIDAPFYPVARLAGAKCAAHLRVNLDNWLIRVLYRAWSSFLCHRVVTISRSVATRASMRGERSVMIHDPGPDPALFRPEAPAHEHPRFGDTRVKVCVNGAFREVKGHEGFVRIADNVCREDSRKYTFVIVGGVVPGHEKYHATVVGEIARYGLEDSFLLLGSMAHERVPSVLRHTDIFVHVPNYQEGLGIVVLEAMQMSIPVIAYDSGGVGECFTDGVSGFLVEHGDVRGAADRIAELARDAGLRRQMGSNARQEVAEKFGRERYRTEITALYHRLLGEKGSESVRLDTS